MPRTPAELPADFSFPEELPANFDFGTVPQNEIVNDPRAAGLNVPPEIPAEVVPTSWLEAAFPRTARAQGAGATALGVGLDMLSLPGRAYASLGRQEGESYPEALARTGPPEVLAQPGDRLGSEWSDRLAETIMRGPETIPLAALTAATGGGTVAPWLARMGWLGKGGRGALAGVEMGAQVGSRSMKGAQALMRGAEAGGVLGATRQAENIAAGAPVSPGEAGKDLALGAGLGLGGELIALGGRGMVTGAKRGLQQIIKPGTAKQGQEIEGFRRALDAGLLPEMAGWGTMTAAGAGQRFGERLAEKASSYPRVLAAADATGQRVNMSQAFRNADAAMSRNIAMGDLPLGVDDANAAAQWAKDIFLLPDDPAMVTRLRSGWEPPAPRGPVAMRSQTVEIAPEQVTPAQSLRGPVIPRSVQRVIAPASDPLGSLGSPIPPKVLEVISGVRQLPGATVAGNVTPARTVDVGAGLVRLAPDPVAAAQDVLVSPSVANKRKIAAWNEAFKDPTKATGKSEMAKSVGRGTREQLDQISPELAAMNAELAPWYAGAPAMLRAAGPRGNAYGVGPMELLGAGAGAGVFGSQDGIGGGIGGGLGAALAVRYLRSPAAMRALYDIGGVLGGAAAPIYRRTLPITAAAIDNARGGRR